MRVRHPDDSRQLDGAAEESGGNAAVRIGVHVAIAFLFAGDDQAAFMELDVEVVFAETRHGKADALRIVAHLFDF